MSKARSNRRLRTFVKRFVNPVLRNFARSSHGPFAMLRHVGRRSGKQYETPIMVWRMKDGFMIVLTSALPVARRTAPRR